MQRLEVLCKQLYESQDASARSEAEKGLVTFQNSGDRYVFSSEKVFFQKRKEPFNKKLIKIAIFSV